MAKGNKIIVTANPKGHFEEIIVVGTPKPGTAMHPTTAARVGGALSMEPAGTTSGQGMGADGDQIPIAILLSALDHPACPPGDIATTAYVTAARGAVYYPAMGEELNILFGNQSGTADDVVANTTKMMINDGDGLFYPTTGTPESEPFLALESITDPTADQLIWAKYSGY
jgi:hypothetical protein